LRQECSATVDIIPLFLRASPDFEVKEGDLIVSYPAKEDHKIAENMVCIHHIPSGVTLQSSGILECVVSCYTLVYCILCRLYNMRFLMQEKETGLQTGSKL